MHDWENGSGKRKIQTSGKKKNTNKIKRFKKPETRRTLIRKLLKENVKKKKYAIARCRRDKLISPRKADTCEQVAWNFLKTPNVSHANALNISFQVWNIDSEKSNEKIFRPGANRVEGLTLCGFLQIKLVFCTRLEKRRWTFRFAIRTESGTNKKRWRRERR